MTVEDAVEGEVREVEEEPVPERALVVAQASLGGGELATMSDETFAERLAQLVKVRNRLDEVKRSLMVPGVDYGEPFAGSNKAMLYKSGAETMLRAFGLVDTYDITERFGDGEHDPTYSVKVYASIHVGDADGPVIATGVGSANTFEVKHRYRGKTMRVCPDCGKENVIHSKPPREGWWCGTRDGGCGHNFAEDDERITGQQVGRAENEDPYDLANTIIKMGKKRAQVDGVLTATGASRLFTQDEDSPGHRENRPQPASGAARTAGAGSAAQSGAPASATPQRPSTGRTAADDGVDVDLKALRDQGIVQAVVSERPEAGVRRVRDGHTPKRWEGERAKLEVVTRVKGSKHTGIVLGELAEAAAVAALQIDEVVRFVDVWVEEIEWQAGKPKKKEVIGLPAAGYLMTDLLVMRNGEWTSVRGSAPSLGLDANGSQPDSTPAAPSPSTTSDAATSTPTSTAPSPSTSGSTPSPATTTAPSEPPQRIVGTTGEWAGMIAQVVDPLVFTQKGDTPVVKLRLADAETGGIIMAALGKDIEESVGTEATPAFGPGDMVTLYGEWKGDWFIVDTIGRKP